MTAGTMHARTCAAADCGAPFSARSRLAVFCSSACAKRERRQRPAPASRLCADVDCQAPFAPRDNRQRYCTPACTDRAYKARGARGQRSDGLPTYTPALASTVRRGTPTYVAKPIRWISPAPPVLMAEAQAQFDALLAREAMTAGRPRTKGVARFAR